MKLIIAGDFCPTDRLAKSIRDDDFDGILGQVKPIINTADYAIVNYECPVVLADYGPIEKSGPNLSSTKNGVEAVKYAGFKMVTLANNHILDYGVGGLNDTIKTCQEAGLDVVGVGQNLAEASSVFYKEIDGTLLAIINCCEHEFSIAGADSPGANPLNPIRQYYQIQEARKKANYVLVIVHGGHEHFQFPSPRMVETYRFFVDAGADIVVNHHQHCFSGHERYKSGLIFYGLGNFCFDNASKRKSIWNEGFMLRIDIGKGLAFEMIPYVQNDEKVGVHLLPRNAYLDRLKLINEVISSDDLLRQYFSDFVETRRIFNDFLFQPYHTFFAKRLYYRGLLPNVYPRLKKVLFENIVCCESHRDVLESYLRKNNKDSL